MLVAAFATTLLGVAWVGGGLAHLPLVRDIPDERMAAIFTVLLTPSILRRVHYRSSSPRAGDLAVEEIVGVAVTFFALYKQDVVSTGESLLLGVAIGRLLEAADLFESAVKCSVSGSRGASSWARRRPRRVVLLWGGGSRAGVDGTASGL